MALKNYLRSKNLNQSNSDFPCNLAMIEKDETGEKLIGHSRLSRVVGEPDALYLSSVIIKEEKRGKGLGKKLLQMVEDFAKPQGFSTIYLNTKSTPFYEKSGYVDCSPVQEYTTKAMEERIIQLQDCFGCKSRTSDTEACETGCDEVKEESKETNVVCCTSPDIPPPPPIPPMPSPCKKIECTPDHECNCPFWMKKILK